MLYWHELISFERNSNNVSVHKVVVMSVSSVVDLANIIFYAKLKLVMQYLLFPKYMNIYRAKKV